MFKKKQDALSKPVSGTLSKQVKSLSVGALEQALLRDFPAQDAEAWDKTGMLVGNAASEVKGVAIALDASVLAIREAAKCGANVLVTHHPLFLDAPDKFFPATSTAQTSGSAVWAAIEAGVSVVSFHTALDVSEHASRVLPSMLGLNFVGKFIEPLATSKRKGYGQVCTISATDAPFNLAQLSARATSVFGRAPRVWGDFSTVLKRVVTCTGSAGNIGVKCLDANIDCLICGEIKYHSALELSQAGLCIIDLGHDVSELPLSALLAKAVVRAGVASNCVTVLDQSGNWAYPESVRI